MTIPPLVLKKRFKARREQVFAAWSNPEIVKLWFKPNNKWSVNSSNTFKVGGHYKYVLISEEGNAYDHIGEYKEIVPPKKIVFTWNSPAVQNTLVTVELEEKDGHTELTLTHDLFANDVEKEKHNQGWKECLQNLEDCVAKK